VSNIQKRGGHTPRKAREQRAYRLVVTGGVTGAAGAVGLVLAIAGVVGAFIPIVLLLVALACYGMFRSLTTPR
jgi:CHASE2 domain-containing sensor protein